jgi:hypothetical protein
MGGCASLILNSKVYKNVSPTNIYDANVASKKNLQGRPLRPYDMFPRKTAFRWEIARSQTGVRFAQNLQPWVSAAICGRESRGVVPGRVVKRNRHGDPRAARHVNPATGASWWRESIAATMSALVTKDVV